MEWHQQSDYWFRPREIPERPKRAANAVYGRGRLATQRDVESLLSSPVDDLAALRLPEVVLLLESADEDARLTPLKHRDLYFPGELRERHVLAVGGTGVGKTQKLILPQIAADIADPNRAVIALDAKGGVLYDYMTALAGKHRPGAIVHQINVKRPNRNTLTWNPVSAIRSRGDALEVAHAVCTNVEQHHHVSSEAFWVNSSINLLADLLLALALDPREKPSLARAKELVDGFPTRLVEFAEAHPVGYPALYRLLENPNQNPNTSIVADLAMRLLLFGDSGITQCTSGPNQLDVRQIVRTGGMLVLEVYESDSAELLPLTNLFITRLFSELIDEATCRPDGRLPRPTSLTLDELGSACGRIPHFEVRLATLRSRGVSLIGAVQSLAQFNHLYHAAAESILGNFNTKIFFGGGLSLTDSKYASELSGVMTAENVTVVETTHGDQTTVSQSRTPVPRAVLLPEEVARPPVHPLLGSPATIFTPTLPPFMAFLTPAYQLHEISWALTARWEGSLDPPEEEEGSTLDYLPRFLSEDPQPDDPEMHRKISVYKNSLGWSTTSGDARRWWTSFERSYRQTPVVLCRLLEKLDTMRRLFQQLSAPNRSLLEEFWQARLQSGVRSLDGNVAFLQWSLLKRWEEQQLNRTSSE